MATEYRNNAMSTSSLRRWCEHFPTPPSPPLPALQPPSRAADLFPLFCSPAILPKRRLTLPRFPLKEIVFQVLCPKGKLRKFRSSLPIHARTNPPYPAIRGFVGPKRFRSCVSERSLR